MVGLTSLQGVGSRVVESIFIRALDQLESFAGLERVRGLRSLSVADSLLSSWQGLPALDDLQRLSVIGSSLLTELPPGLAAALELRDLRIVRSAVTAIELPNVTSLDALRVAQNKALQSLTMVALQSARQLEITENPLLPPEALAPFEAIDARYGQVRAERPLRPCPWKRDDVCDEALGLCAEGTDAADCEAAQ